MQSTRAFAVLMLLLLLGVASPMHTANADTTPESCTNKCVETRDLCKANACKAGGGHSQIHQGVCYNLPLNNKQTHSAALAKCDAKAHVCYSKCNK